MLCAIVEKRHFVLIAFQPSHGAKLIAFNLHHGTVVFRIFFSLSLSAQLSLSQYLIYCLRQTNRKKSFEGKIKKNRQLNLKKKKKKKKKQTISSTFVPFRFLPRHVRKERKKANDMCRFQWLLNSHIVHKQSNNVWPYNISDQKILFFFDFVSLSFCLSLLVFLFVSGEMLFIYIQMSVCV